MTKLLNKIVNSEKILIFLFWHPQFNFLTIICEIRKKYKFAKLFVSIRFKNFVRHSLYEKEYP